MKKQVTLIADDGNWLTQADMSIIDERFFVTIITVPAPQYVDNYIEVTDEWKVQWEEEHQPEPEQDAVQD